MPLSGTKKRIRELEEQQLTLKRWAQDLRCEASRVLLERAGVRRELDQLKRQVFEAEVGITKVGVKEVTTYNSKKIASILASMSEDQMKELARMLEGEQEEA